MNNFFWKICFIIWIFSGIAFGQSAGDFVKKEELATFKEKNSEEFREISVSLAELKNDMSHIQQDLTELKDLRRSMFDRMIDIILAGGLAFTGAKVLRRKNDRKNLPSNNL